MFIPRGDGLVDFVDENDNILLSGIPERAALELGGRERPRQIGDIGLDTAVPAPTGDFQQLPDKPVQPVPDAESPFAAQGELETRPLTIDRPELLGPPAVVVAPEVADAPNVPVVAAPLDVDLTPKPGPEPQTAKELATADEELGPIKARRFEEAEEAFMSASDLREQAINERLAAEEEAQRQVVTNMSKASLRFRQLAQKADELSKDPVDPGRFWANSGLFQKAAMIVSAAIDGYLNPGGKNGAVQMVQNLVNRDVELQLSEMERKRRALNEERGFVSDEMEVAEEINKARYAGKIARVNALLAVANSRTTLGGDLLETSKQRAVQELLGFNKDKIIKEGEIDARRLQLDESRFLAQMGAMSAKISRNNRIRSSAGVIPDGPFTVYGIDGKPAGVAKTENKKEALALRNEVKAYFSLAKEMNRQFRKLKKCDVGTFDRLIEWSPFRAFSPKCLQEARATRSTIITSALNFAKASDRDVKLMMEGFPSLGDLTSGDPVAIWMNWFRQQGVQVDDQLRGVGIHWSAVADAQGLFLSMEEGAGKAPTAGQARKDALLGLMAPETAVVRKSATELIFTKGISLDDLRKGIGAIRARRRQIKSEGLGKEEQGKMLDTLEKAEFLIRNSLDERNITDPFEPIPLDQEKSIKESTKKKPKKKGKFVPEIPSD